MIDMYIKEAKPKMLSAIDNLRTELSRIRTGRANPAILDGVVVSYYGTNTPLREVASISAPEPTQILVKPWDKNALSDIEIAIRNANLGVSPVNDGTGIRISLPPLTEERRKEIATSVKKAGEECKVSIRNIRREAWEKVQTAEKNKEVTEDDRRWAEEELNKLVNEMNSLVEKVVAEKEAEVMKI
ncbi:MAG TPA: ribosome recycling factor [bacterium]|nr:ribosome recycling factor [bacterium]